MGGARQHPFGLQGDVRNSLLRMIAQAESAEPRTEWISHIHELVGAWKESVDEWVNSDEDFFPVTVSRSDRRKVNTRMLRLCVQSGCTKQRGQSVDQAYGLIASHVCAKSCGKPHQQRYSRGRIQKGALPHAPVIPQKLAVVRRIQDERVVRVFAGLNPSALQAGDVVDDFVVEKELLLRSDFSRTDDRCHTKESVREIRIQSAAAPGKQTGGRH